ncbi:uncharacterized protein LOC111240824 [Vigna radiata var. radiata]|uniref:Uncharacterized protein LOC111240824 n=1 Tax=Vigna radiata var. radiata TaxID=3916 RepID=A0A3Q0EK80_VIGRR|nr:uncharacterized protein LOC111240824 [Vigna radiata var. radiata]
MVEVQLATIIRDKVVGRFGFPADFAEKREVWEDSPLDFFVLVQGGIYMSKAEDGKVAFLFSAQQVNDMNRVGTSSYCSPEMAFHFEGYPQKGESGINHVNCWQIREIQLLKGTATRKSNTR